MGGRGTKRERERGRASIIPNFCHTFPSSSSAFHSEWQIPTRRDAALAGFDTALLLCSVHLSLNWILCRELLLQVRGRGQRCDLDATLALFRWSLPESPPARSLPGPFSLPEPGTGARTSAGQEFARVVEGRREKDACGK